VKDPNPKIGFGTGSGVVNNVGGVGVKEPLPPTTGGAAGGEVKEPLGIEGSPIVNEPLAASPGSTADGEVKEPLGTEGCPAVNEPLVASPSLRRSSRIWERSTSATSLGTLGPSAVAGSDIDVSRGKTCNEGAGTATGGNASGVATKELGIWRGPGAVLMAAWKLVPCIGGGCDKFIMLGKRLVNGIGSGLGSLAIGVGDIERANG